MQMRCLIGMQKAAGVVPKASAEDEWCLSAARARSAAGAGRRLIAFFPLKVVFISIHHRRC